MLVLSRFVGESITLFNDGKPITVHVFEQRGQKIAIGIDAPREIRVVRTELLQDNETRLIDAA